MTKNNVRFEMAESYLLALAALQGKLNIEVSPTDWDSVHEDWQAVYGIPVYDGKRIDSFAPYPDESFFRVCIFYQKPGASEEEKKYLNLYWAPAGAKALPPLEWFLYMILRDLPRITSIEKTDLERIYKEFRHTPTKYEQEANWDFALHCYEMVTTHKEQLEELFGDEFAALCAGGNS